MSSDADFSDSEESDLGVDVVWERVAPPLAAVDVDELDVYQASAKQLFFK